MAYTAARHSIDGVNWKRRVEVAGMARGGFGNMIGIKAETGNGAMTATGTIGITTQNAVIARDLSQLPDSNCLGQSKAMRFIVPRNSSHIPS